MKKRTKHKESMLIKKEEIESIGDRNIYAFVVFLLVVS